SRVDVQKKTTDAEIALSVQRLRRGLVPLEQGATALLPRQGQSALGNLVREQYGRVTVRLGLVDPDPRVRAAAQQVQAASRMIFSLIKAEAGGTKGLRIT